MRRIIYIGRGYRFRQLPESLLCVTNTVAFLVVYFGGCILEYIILKVCLNHYLNIFIVFFTIILDIVLLCTIFKNTKHIQKNFFDCAIYCDLKSIFLKICCKKAVVKIFLFHKEILDNV